MNTLHRILSKIMDNMLVITLVTSTLLNVMLLLRLGHAEKESEYYRDKFERQENWIFDELTETDAYQEWKEANEYGKSEE